MVVGRRGDGSCVHAVDNLPFGMIAVTASQDTAHIVCAGGNICLVHTINNVYLNGVILTGSAEAAGTHAAGNRAALVNNQVLDDRSFTL